MPPPPPVLTYSTFAEVCVVNKVKVSISCWLPPLPSSRNQPSVVFVLDDKEVGSVLRLLASERSNQALPESASAMHDKLLSQARIKSVLETLDEATKSELLAQLQAERAHKSGEAAALFAPPGAAAPAGKAANPSGPGFPSREAQLPSRVQFQSPFVRRLDVSTDAGDLPASERNPSLKRKKVVHADAPKDDAFAFAEGSSEDEDDESGDGARRPAFVNAVAAAGGGNSRAPGGTARGGQQKKKTGRKGFVRVTFDDDRVPPEHIWIHGKMHLIKVRQNTCCVCAPICVLICGNRTWFIA